MPFLSKRVISNYFRSNCYRRLRLDLSPDNQHYRSERQAANMPPRSVSRPGLYALAAAGEEWEEAKLNDLAQTFGINSILGASTRTASGGYHFSDVPLANIIRSANPGTFLVQAQYNVGSTFENALGVTSFRTTHGLDYAELRPDIIQVFASGDYEQEVMPDGTIRDLQPYDRRLPLRLIDIKLTAEPSVSYFIEITYYAMVLASWLIDNRLEQHYFVVPEPTVWPGSHDASAIIRLQREKQSQGIASTTLELMQALEEDIEIGEFRVFAPRLRRFFQEELDTILSSAWQQLDWHVDNRCLGCEYLGYPWPGANPDPNHCWPTAIAQDNLSRVAFVSRGARGVLEDHQIASVTSLAGTHPTHNVYNSHHILRATRTVIAGRAQALNNNQTIIPPQSGTSAVMPAWADLRIYLTTDFDIGSGITVAFGFKAIWAVPQNRIQPGQQHFRPWQAQVFPVDQRDLAVEQRELFNLLNTIHQATQFARNTIQNATVQVYIWDSVTYDHLVRVIGRHLATIIQNRNLNQLAWLFPPDNLIPNPEISDRQNPVTILRDVIRAVVAVPVPHYYSLLNVAREYHSARTQSPYNAFRVPGLFEDPLSDQIPSERAHEIWSRAGGTRPWNQQLRELERTIRVKLDALESVTQRLGDDLRGQLNQTAPRIQNLRPPTLPQRMADDARLWFVYARLNVALAELEIQKIHAMPPHEREARFKSARLTRRLVGQDRLDALSRSNLQVQQNFFVYELSHLSREVRLREGDFTFALAPANQPGFLFDRLRRVAGNLQLPIQPREEWLPMHLITQATVQAIDRDQGYIILEMNPNRLPIINALEQSGQLDFSQDVMLDPIHRDYLIPRIENTLNTIGNPPIATAHAGVPQALGRTRRPTRGTPSPVANIYWDAPTLYQTRVQRVLAPIQALLAANGHDLNSSQWRAWEEALTHRMRLIWGPPGTGKSRTLRNIALGALHEASQQGNSFRILITGPTYEAIDNVFLDVHEALTGNSSVAITGVLTARLRSIRRPLDPRIPNSVDLAVDANSPAFRNLQSRLHQSQGLTVVGATVHQTYKLLELAGSPVLEFFDLIIVDEASQLDVAMSTLALSGLASDGSVVIAGDPKQLPPIHQADAPIGLEHMVGPVFTYMTERHNLQPSVLEENYRSSQTIIEIAHLADYPRSLRAYSPNLAIELCTPLPQTQTPPQGWPAELFWTPTWSSFLNPTQQAVCFVYQEGRSSQWNRFEADAIASLVWLLAGRLGNQLLNERVPPSGMIGTTTRQPYSMNPDFWTTGVGIVTPHRAQQALIVGRLQALFQGTRGTEHIRSAVDTVERFQGQQRDIILATFALGDPDAISDEDEFLLSLNRFNVMASRARAKLIVFVTQELVDHLSSDMKVLRESALLKSFVETFCNLSSPMLLGNIDQGQVRQIPGVFRWR